MPASDAPGGADPLRVNWFHPRVMNVGDAEVAVHLGGEGPPVLLLPGFPCSPRSYLPLAEALARKHYVILPHLPGTGASPPPSTGGYAIPANADRLWNLCDQLGARRLRIVGHGLGGGIAYWLAMRRPEHVMRMVILSAPMRGIGGRFLWEGARLACPGIADLFFGVAGPRLVRRIYARGCGPGFTVDPDELERAAATWSTPTSRRAAVHYHRAAGNLVVWRALRSAWLRVPTLFIFGDQVPAVDRRTIAHTADAAANGRVKLLKGVGRFPHLERSEDVAKAIAEYLGYGL